VLVALAVAAGLRLHADGVTSTDRRTGLERENTTLRTEVARLQAELELERATRSALGRQVDGLSQQVAELDGQLAFFHAQSGRPRKAGRIETGGMQMMFRRKSDQSIEVTKLSSLIDNGVEIVGDVMIKDGLRIDGHVQGEVRCRQDAAGCSC